jgi:FAD/FMN-containing dehydrogenase
MDKLEIATLAGESVSLDPAIVSQLGDALRGTILKPGDDDYDQARTIWNAMIDRRPALIVQCAGVADVILAVDFARTYNLRTAVHGGGHNIAGNAVCNDGLMIDLSQMCSVRVDPKARLADVEPGATLGDFDHEAQAFGLATVLGINSTTGVAGLTLGGGFGWLSRKYGMTVDNLVAVDIVTADGKFLTANASKHADLFWAVRGGGGNFGIVTRFQFQLYPVGPEVLCGLIVFPLEEAASALRQYRKFARGLGDDTCVWVILRQAPPLPFLPAEVHGKEVIVFAVFHTGDMEKGKKMLDPIREFGTMLGEQVGVQPYEAWQKAFDPLLTPGARNYWKSHNFVDLSDEVIEVAVRYASTLPSSQCEIFFAMLGGQVGRIPTDATAYPHRDANFVLNVHARWDDASEDEKCIGWSRKFFKDSAPYATGGVYINFMTEEETDRIAAAFGTSYDRLKKTKKTYDPQNLFRLNQNITPAK